MSLLRTRTPRAFPEIPDEEIPEQFVVRQGGTLLGVGIILTLVFGGACLQAAAESGFQRLDMLGACILCVLAGIVVLAKYKNHRLEVDGQALRYTDLFGRHTTFQVSDIAPVRRDSSENPNLLSENGRVLARCDRSMTGFPLLIAYLKKHRVSADLI